MLAVRHNTIQYSFLILFILIVTPLSSQHGILDSTFTIREGMIRTEKALDIITNKTGYNFTYDSRLVNVREKRIMNFSDAKLSTILDSILNNKSLIYSIIDKYIIISSYHKSSSMLNDSTNYTRDIKGIIEDVETKERLPFATIALKNNGKGTISNNNGEFILNIPLESKNDTIFTSYLGYKSIRLPVSSLKGYNITIPMQKDFIPIPEIIIKNQIPIDIISKARNSITKNYGTTPAYLTGFYREGVFKKNELKSYSEAILKIFKRAYTGSLLNDQIKVIKSRKIENSINGDTLSLRLKAGLSTCLDLDGIRNIFDFLSEEDMKDYNYKLSDIVIYNDETAYAIDFEQRPEIDQPLYKGTIYINAKDYAVLNASFEISQSYIYRMRGQFVLNSSPGYKTWPISAKYSVSYRKIKNRYFLNHVRGDIIFSSKQKKKPFKTQFKVFLELAITTINLDDVTRFQKDELAPINSVFSKTIKTYDPYFWNNQDFLKPEDDLIKSLKTFNVETH